MTSEELIDLLAAAWPILLALLLGAGGLALVLTRRPRPRYRLRPALLTPAEQRFLPLLDRVAGPDARVMSPVRLADVLEPAEGLRGRDRWRALAPILAKHLDFVVVDRYEGRILYAVELDDRSHQRADRRRRDAWLDAACAEAGLPLVRVRVTREYDVESLRMAIETARAAVAPADRPSRSSRQRSARQTPERSGNVTS